jgi:hypothetical protein
MKAIRQTVDLSAYPDLVVVYLGMTVNVLTGVKTLLGFGPKIEGSVAARPDGLLLHENIFYSLSPLHVGMRQYWRDFESLERFTRAEPHREWWKQFCKTLGGRASGTNSILHGAVLSDLHRCPATYWLSPFCQGGTCERKPIFGSRAITLGRSGGHTRAVYGNRAVDPLQSFRDIQTTRSRRRAGSLFDAPIEQPTGD